MIRKKLTVLLIEDSPDYAELVRVWLTDEQDAEFVLKWTDSLLEGMNTLAQGGVGVVLLDLGLPDSNGAETLIAARNAALGVPIIVLSAGDSEALALRMVQEGAQDYLVKSSCSSAVLRKAIHYAVVRYVAQAEKTGLATLPARAKVIGVMGAKGGVGATTVACNLAVELRRQTDERTLLADLDLDNGIANFLLNIESRHTVMDGISHLHHLDKSCWDGIIAENPIGLHIARSPGLLGGSASEIDRFRHLVTLVSGFYRWILLDLGRLNSFSLSMLERVDELFLVTTTSVPALYQAKRIVGALQAEGLSTDRLRLIVNQFGDRNDLSGSELDRIFGIPVYAKLPGSGHELREACVNARPLPDDSEFRGHVAHLARKLAGLPEKRKGIVTQMLSLADKLRRSERRSASTPVA